MHSMENLLIGLAVFGSVWCLFCTLNYTTQKHARLLVETDGDGVVTNITRLTDGDSHEGN